MASSLTAQCELGSSGASSHVFLAKNLRTNKQVVAKKVFYQVEVVRKEMAILEQLEHVGRIRLLSWPAPLKLTAVDDQISPAERNQLRGIYGTNQVRWIIVSKISSRRWVKSSRQN